MTTAPITHCTFRLALLVTSALLSISSGVAARQNTQGPGTAIVSGIVIDSVSRAPIPFARIDLVVNNVGTSARYSTVSAEDGTFRLANVRAGSYLLGASKAAYALTYYRGAGEYGVEPGGPLAIADGARIEGLELKLVRGAVITGQVIDEFGLPADGANVGVRRPDVRPGPGSPIWIASPYDMYRAGANGRYRLYGLSPGRYVIYATSENSDRRLGSTDGPAITYMPRFYPDTSDPAQATTLALAPGEERSNIDLKLRSVRLFNVTGTIAAPPDANLDSANRNVQPIQPELVGIKSIFPYFRDGHVTIDNVPPGEYRLTVYAGPKQRAEAGADNPLYWAATAFRVEDRDVTDVSLSLQLATRVSGRLLLKQEGSPAILEGTQLSVTLAVRPGETRLIDIPALPGRPNAAGEFTITRTTPGRYRFQLGGSSGTHLRIVSVQVGDRALPDGEIDIVPGVSIENVLIVAEVVRAF